MTMKTTTVSRTYHGWNALNQLPDIVNQYAVENVLIITDPFLNANGVAASIAAMLTEQKVTICDKVAAEPPLAVAESLVQFTKASNCQLVIGLGGGSALDLAKIAAVLATHRGKVADYLNLSGTKSLNNKGLPKIMIPTTSGTGSEVTNIAVFSLEQTKDVIMHDYLLADVALVDPALTVSMPARVTAATGIDALTHAIESYVSIQANPITDSLALHATSLISSALRNAVANGDDREARTNMSYGSYLAGIAFFNAGVAGVHALAYPLGGQFHISHGESNALLLAHVMSHIRSSCEHRLRDIYHAMGFSVEGLTNQQASLACIKEIKQLIADIGIPKNLQAFAIAESSLADLTRDALKQTRLLARSPMPLLEADIFSIYHAAWSAE